MKSFIRILKKSKVFVIIMAMLIVVMGFTSFAATTGTISGYYSGGTAVARVRNTNSNLRYCEVYIKAGSNVNSLSTIKYLSGTVSAGNSLSTSKNSSAAHIRGYGVIYNGGNPNAGVGWSNTTWIK